MRKAYTKLTDSQIISMIRKVDQGQSMASVGQEFGVSASHVRYWSSVSTSHRAEALRERAKQEGVEQDEKAGLSPAKRSRKHVSLWMKRQGLVRKHVIVPEAKLREFKATAKGRGENIYQAFGKALDMYVNANENRPAKKGWLNKLIG